MSFLAPLYLLGLAGLALPLVLHMLRRDTRRRVEFSSLMLLDKTPILIRRRSRLQDILLLLLRCAALAILALAFARPLVMSILPSPQTQIGSRVLVMIDTSASMRREGIWTDAMAELRDSLSHIGAGDRAAVFAFDRQVKPIINFGQPVGNLDTLAPTWAATDLGGALVAAVDAMRADETDETRQVVAQRRRIVLISDMQEGADVTVLRGMDWPADIKLELRTVVAKKPTNAGLHAVATPDAAIDSDLTPRLRVLNASGSTAGQFAVQWADAAGKLQGQAVETYIPPGAGALLRAPALPEGLDHPHIVLTGDDHDFDNTVYLAPPSQRTVAIGYLGEDAINDPHSMRFFLQRVFAPTRTLKPVIGDISLPAKLVIAAGRFDPQLHQRLAEGATIVYVMTDAASADGLAQLLRLPALSAQEIGDHPSRIGSIDLTHPLLAVFADPRFSDFTKIHFWRHRRLSAGALPDAHVLASFDDGDPVWISVGRVLIMTTSWRPEDGQLALSSKFLPLMYSLLEQSGAASVQQRTWHVGDLIGLPENATALRGPDGVVIKDGVATQPGLYAIATPEGELTAAVNVPPGESRTAPMASGQLEALGVALEDPARTDKAANISPEAQATLGRIELEQQQKYWRWCVLAAIAVLLMETILAGRAGHVITARKEVVA